MLLLFLKLEDFVVFGGVFYLYNYYILFGRMIEFFDWFEKECCVDWFDMCLVQVMYYEKLSYVWIFQLE